MDVRLPYISLSRRKNIFIEYFRKAWLIIVFGVILYIAGTVVLLNNEVFCCSQITSSICFFIFNLILPRK